MTCRVVHANLVMGNSQLYNAGVEKRMAQAEVEVPGAMEFTTANTRKDPVE